MNGVPREVPMPKPEGPQALRFFGRGTPFIMIHTRLFHTFLVFSHTGLAKSNFLHCRQTQPVPRKYHTQCYVVEVQTLVKLNSNILVRDVESMYIEHCTLQNH